MHIEQFDNLKLGIYPYTYVRTTVMKSALFQKEDYQKMLKMDFNEIAKYLQESSYKMEINKLATEFSGVDLIELALNRNLAASFKKLLRISPPELRLIVSEYIKRRDIEDLKTILRGKLTSAGQKAIESSITGAGTLSFDFLLSLIKKESVEEILKRNKLFDFSAFRELMEDYKKNSSLASIESQMDKLYYSRLLELSRLLPKEGVLFRTFILKEIAILNMLTLLRLKKAKFSKEKTRKFIISFGDKKLDSRMNGMVEAENFDDLAKLLEKTEYKDVIKKGIDEFKKTGSLILLETELYKHLLKQSILMLHQHPLSVDVILGYMLAKDIEVRNLRVIIKGKQLGLGEEFIESQLVY